jgi:hypothetical protein
VGSDAVSVERRWYEGLFPLFTPRQSKTKRKRVRRKESIQMELFFAIFLVWLFWRVRSILKMLEETRDDDRYGHS